MKNLIVIVFLFFIVVFWSLWFFVFDSKKDNCLDSGGMWYQNYCLEKNSPKTLLKEIGLVEEKESDKIEVSVRYPFEILNFSKVHEYLKNEVEEIKHRTGFDGSLDEEIETSSYPWKLSIDMNNFTFAGNFASILGYIFSYTGGAHPNHSFYCVNFDKNSEEIINFSNLFKNKESAVKAISKYSIAKLYEEKSRRLGEEVKNDDWVLRGASADENNYLNFVFVPSDKIKIVSGIKFVFPPYWVGSYAEGSYEVFVPSEVFYEFLVEKFKSDFK